MSLVIRNNRLTSDIHSNETARTTTQYYTKVKNMGNKFSQWRETKDKKKLTKRTT